MVRHGWDVFEILFRHGSDIDWTYVKHEQHVTEARAWHANFGAVWAPGSPLGEAGLSTTPPHMCRKAQGARGDP